MKYRQLPSWEGDSRSTGQEIEGRINIKFHFKETGCQNVNGSEMAQNRVQSGCCEEVDLRGGKRNFLIS